MIEREKWGKYGALVAEAYKVSGNGLIVSFYEQPVQWGRVTTTVIEWDRFGLYDETVETHTDWDKGFRSYLSRAFGVEITNPAI